jgi:hypothetical protein
LRAASRTVSRVNPDRPGYDADAVAMAARESDPGLPRETSLRLARQAWQHLSDVGPADPSEIARRLFAANRDEGASAANVVAMAAVEFCIVHDLDPQA